MIDKNDAYRIADAITALRPTWNRNQILSVIGMPSIKDKRDPRDTLAALAWLALDPETRQPTRLLEAGRWWGCAEPHLAGKAKLPPHADDCIHCGNPPSGLHANHDYEPRIPWLADTPGAPCPEHVRQLIDSITSLEQPTRSTK